MVYVSYEFYRDEYGGKLVAPEQFSNLENIASATVDFYTFNRITEVDDKIRFAVCELVDYLYGLAQTGGKEVASEKVSTHSITYATNTQEGIDPVKKKQRDIVAKYLLHTGLMYRGH